MSNKILILLVSVFLLASCGGKKEHVTHKGSTNHENVKFHEPEVLTSQEFPIITFKSRTYAAGDLREGEKVTRKFEFTNTGAKDLTIYAVSAECDCLEVSYPEDPIAPGESDFIQVTYNSKGYSGPVQEIVIVNSNANTSAVPLTIMCNVI